MKKIKKFYCIGVPRSGSTYFGRLINSHPNAFCGMESYSPNTLKTDYFTADLFSKNIEKHRTKAIEHAEINLSKKTDIMAIGDKYPRGYLQYKNIIKEMNGDVIFVLSRLPGEVFFSWNRRANNINDKSWKRGQNWIFSYLEMIHLMTVLGNSPRNNIYIINYDYLTGIKTRFDAANDIFKILNLEAEESVNNYLHDSMKITIKSMNLNRLTDRHQDEILSSRHMKHYSDIIRKIKIKPLTDIEYDIFSFYDILNSEYKQFNNAYKKTIYSMCKNEHFIDYWLEVQKLLSKSFVDSPISKMCIDADKIVNNYRRPPKFWHGFEARAKQLRDKLTKK